MNSRVLSDSDLWINAVKDKRPALIRKTRDCACAGNAGERFPRHRLKKKPLVSHPGMHYGTCVTHVPWCMSEPLTRSGGENFPGNHAACAIRNFMYLVRGPWWVHRPCKYASPCLACCHDFIKDHSGFRLSQWKTTLKSNASSHWLSLYTEWSLINE